MLETLLEPEILTREKFSGLDNQQERLVNIGWLCGIIDGEGTITITRSNKRANGKQSITPSIQVTTTCQKMISRLQQIAFSLSVGCFVYNDKKRFTFSWHVFGSKRLLTLLPQIIPHLTTKKSQAEFQLLYCASRASKSKNNPYNAYELDLYAKIKNLNIKPLARRRLQESSETTRCAPVMPDEDIVRPQWETLGVGSNPTV